MDPQSLKDIRQEYKYSRLDEADLSASPFEQFSRWFEQVLRSELTEPTAMTLATASPGGQPSARIVLLKDFGPEGFGFYTNYESRKGRELEENPRAALLFFWKELERQVRLEGSVQREAAEASDAYFRSRPLGSRLGAWASSQSREIPDRAYLEREMERMEKRFRTEEPHRPPFWGGYLLKPTRFEFWQGRESRLHDRFQYTLESDGSWSRARLAP